MTPIGVILCRESIKHIPEAWKHCFDYDSPGYSAELCTVTAIEKYSKQVLSFSVVHKKEVENVSGRMELSGGFFCFNSHIPFLDVKKCLASIESKLPIYSWIKVILYVKNPISAILC